MGTSTTAGAADGAGWNQWAQPTNGAGEACRSYPGCERCLLRSGPKECFRCWAMRGAGRPACLEPAALLGLQLKFLARTGGRDLQLQDFHSGFPALAPPNHGKLSASTSRRAEPPARHRPSCCPSSADTTEPLWDTAPSTSHCPTSDTKTTSCKTSPELQPRAQPGRAAASIPAALHRSLLLTAGPG